MAKTYIEVEWRQFRKALEAIARSKKDAAVLRSIAQAALENSFEGVK